VGKGILYAGDDHEAAMRGERTGAHEGRGGEAWIPYIFWFDNPLDRVE
jgi:hypothetical protein